MVSFAREKHVLCLAKTNRWLLLLKFNLVNNNTKVAI